MESNNASTSRCDIEDKSMPPETSGGRHQRSHLYMFDEAPRMVVLFAVVALSVLVLFHSASPLQLPPQYNPFSLFASTGNESTTAPPNLKKVVDLESMLKMAAMEDKTVVITTLNEAWAEPNSMFDLLLESFRIGYQTQRFSKHLVVLTLDEKAYNRCSQIHSYCHNLTTNGTDFSGEEAFFMTPRYLKIVWKKIDFLRTVLNLGYNFIFTDADIMWFRDPFPHFDANADLQITCDYFGGNATDMKNNVANTGFSFVRSNNKTIRFYEFWNKSRETFPGMHDQDVFNRLREDPLMAQIGLQIRFLDTAYFGGFCSVARDLNKVCTMHANCCVGLDNKVYDLGIMLDDWRKYVSSQANVSAPQYSSWTVPIRCGPPSFLPRSPKKKPQGEGSKR